MSDSAPRRTMPVRDRLLEPGALRIALLAAVAILVASAPFATLDPDAMDAIDLARALIVENAALGSRDMDLSLGIVWAALVAPPLAVMMAFVVPLDMLMSRIYMTDKHGAERARFRRILAVEALALAALIAAWAPFFVDLLSL